MQHNGFHAHHARSAPVIAGGAQDNHQALEKRFGNADSVTADQQTPATQNNKNKGRRPRPRRYSESAHSAAPLSRTPPANRFSPQHHFGGRQTNDDRMNQLRPLFQIPSVEKKKNEARKVTATASSPLKSQNVGEVNHRVSPTSRHYAGPKFTESPAASELPLPPTEWLPLVSTPKADESDDLAKVGTIYEQAAVQVANIRLRNLLSELQQSPSQISVGIGA